MVFLEQILCQLSTLIMLCYSLLKVPGLVYSCGPIYELLYHLKILGLTVVRHRT